MAKQPDEAERKKKVAEARKMGAQIEVKRDKTLDQMEKKALEAAKRITEQLEKA